MEERYDSFGRRLRPDSASPPRDRGSPRRDDRDRYRGGGGRDDRGGGGKRGRSPPSGGYHRGGSPPAKRGRGRDEWRDDRDGRGRGRYDDRGRDRDRRRMMTFREFVGGLRDGVTPAEAEQRFAAYQQEFKLRNRRDYFEENRDQAWMREKHDPRKLEAELGPVLDRRDEASRAAAARFASTWKELEFGPTGSEASEEAEMAALAAANGSGDGEEGEEKMADEADGAGAEDEEDEDDDEAGPKRRGKGASKPRASPVGPVTPVHAWAPERLAADVKLATSLVRALDDQKGIEENPIVGPSTESGKGDGAATAAAAGNGDDAADDDDDGPKAMESGEETPAWSVSVRALNPLLLYLWRVHGVDYYATREVPADKLADGMANAEPRRMVRCARPTPEETQASEEDAEKEAPATAEQEPKTDTAGAAKDAPAAKSPAVAHVGLDAAVAAAKAVMSAAKQETAEQWGKRVSNFWTDRIADGSPEELRLGRVRAKQALERWFSESISKVTDTKYQCPLCVKQFLSVTFVRKHILNKHPEDVERKKERALDAAFYDNFSREADEEEKRMDEVRRQQDAIAAAHRGGSGGASGGGGGGYRGGGRGGGPPPPMMSGPPLAMGQILVPAPGAGPMGPFVPINASGGGGGGHGASPPVPPANPFPGLSPPAPRNPRQYIDLDAEMALAAAKDDRTLLDYGDL